MKRVWTFLTALCLIVLCLCLFPQQVQAVAEGTCGENLTWTLDQNGALVISGTGVLKDSPWDYGYRDGIQSVTLGDGITGTEVYLFSGLYHLENVVIGNGMTTIAEGLFYDCPSLQNVTIGTSVQAIKQHAFSCCSALKNITIPGNVTSLEQQVFSQSGLTALTVPGSIQTIPQNLVYNCASLKTLTLQEGVTTVEAYGITDCAALETINLPKSLTTLGAYAFGWCDRLETVYYNGMQADWDALVPDAQAVGLDNVSVVPLALTEVNGTCGDHLTWVLNEDGLLTISGTGAMPDFTSGAQTPWAACRERIRMVKLDSGITHIGAHAFDDCGIILVITIPESVISVGENAFRNCNNLISVDYRGTEAQSEAITIASGNERLTETSWYCKYTVTFQNWDGTVLSEAFYFYMEQVEVPADPVRKADKTYTYQFTGWDPEVVQCMESTVYTAQYEKTYRNYTVTFKDWDGKVLSTKNYHYGDQVTVPSNPTRAASKNYQFVFKGWNKTVAASCTGKAVYTATYQSRLYAPTVKVTNNAASGKPVVSWNAVTGAAQYEVYRATAKNGTYVRLAATAKRTYTDSAAKAGVTYYYKVKAIGAKTTVLSSNFSKIVNLTCKLARPAVTVTHQQNKGTNVLKWNKISGATTYVVQVSVNGGAYKDLTSTKQLTYTHKNVAGGSTYRYRLIAKSSAGAVSAYSAVKTVTAKCALPVVTVSLNAAGKPLVKWNAVNGAAKYQVYVSTTRNGAYKLVKTVTGRTVTHTAAAKGGTFYYKVRAVDAKGVAGNFSTVRSIVTR